MLQDLPQPLTELLKNLGEEPADLVIAVLSDMDAAGYFDPEWLVITKEHLRVFSSKHDSEELTEFTQRLVLRLAELESTYIDGLIGGGALMAVIGDESIEVVRYTHSKQHVIGQINKYLNEVAKARAREGTESNGDLTLFPPQSEEKPRCPRCKLLLPEGTTICPACMSKARVLVRLAKYLKPYLKESTILSSMLLATTGLGLISPYLTKPLMDVVLVPRGPGLPLEGRLFWLGIIIVGMLLSQILSHGISIIQGRAAARLAHKLTHSLRVEVYRHLQLLSIRFFEKRRTGALMTRVTQDIEELESVLSTGTQFFVANILTLIGIIVVLSFLSWRLFLELLIPIPLVFILSRMFWRKLQSLWPRWWHYRARLHAAINENFSGIRVVKSFAQEEREIERFSPRSYKLSEAGIRAEQTWATLFPILSFFTGIGALLVWCLGGREVLASNLTVGTLLTFVAYLSMFYGPLQFVNRFSSWLGRTLAAAERVFDILDTAPDVPEAADPLLIENLCGAVEFKNVSFGYDADKPVLKNFNLKVEPGEMIGLVGHSGAGKTTTINLLCRLYDVDEGELLIDGLDIRKIGQKNLRQQFGFVMQDSFLFNCAIRDNIAYSKPEATCQELIAAAKAANAHDFISAKPDGYDTVVGERGNSLSVGERQRISIARAVIHNPRFLILDEATSSVDADTEKQIQNAIVRLSRGRTTFVVAHRFSTLRNADRLVVIKDGKILEIGTHKELLKTKGEFYRMLETQQALPASNVTSNSDQTDDPADNGWPIEDSVNHEPEAVTYLRPEENRLTREGATVTLTTPQNARVSGVKISRLFPLTTPDRFLSVRDHEDQELGIILDSRQMDRNSQQVISEELERRYVTPIVERIVWVKERFGTVDWGVETTRGSRTFTMRNLRENIAEPAPGRYILSDVDGNRYDVPNIESLDAKSRAHLWRYL